MVLCFLWKMKGIHQVLDCSGRSRKTTSSALNGEKIAQTKIKNYNKILIISLKTIIQFCIFINCMDEHIKLQQDDCLVNQKANSNTVFKISLAQSQIKPQFVAFTGNWTNFENAKYCAFIKHNKNKIQGKPHSKLWQIYKEMAAFVETRNFRQCKAHHQKLCQQLPEIPEIIAYLQSTVQDFSCLFQMQMQRIAKFNLQKFAHVENPKLDNLLNPEAQPPKIIFSRQPQFKTSQNYAPQMPNRIYFPYKQGMGIQNPQRLFQYEQNKIKQRQWMQCHYLFMEWTSRLMQLSQMNPTF